MEHTASNREIHATLWPQRLVNVRRSLNRSSRVIVIIGLFGLAGGAFWVTYERGPQAPAFNILEYDTWIHPAYINSLLMAVMILYAMRQIRRTRQRLNPLGYPLLEKVDTNRHLDVWRSVEPLTLRPVMLHVISPAKSPSGRENWKALSQTWIRRAHKARRLSSPHIARLIDAGYAQHEQFYAVIELARGIRLDDLINNHGPCPVHRTLYLLAQLAHAIQDAHAQGIAPLDLKPRNIRVGQRTLNEDWLTLMLFGYETPEGNNENPAASDRKEFARLAISMITGRWLNEETREDLVAIDEALEAAGAPYMMRDLLRQCLSTSALEAMPPVHEIMRRLWATQTGEHWNNDLAAEWWREHQSKEPEACASQS